jgi:TPP-dependent pyruvate/acetoin dehydrogenase alpha subunit
MHLISTQDRFFGGNAIVAAGIPQAVGLGLASKKLNEDRLTVVFFGEGAIAEGVFHEALNMAELWKIPVLFCCENNYYAMGTAIERSQAQLNLSKKAQAHNVTCDSVDGMNVIEVVEKTKVALDFIKDEGRPYFLEFRTYRFRSHSMFDPDLYRKKEEVNKWKEKDPIQFIMNHLEKNNLLSQDVLNDLDQKVEKEMQDALSFAENAEEEPKEDLEKYLYENEL